MTFMETKEIQLATVVDEDDNNVTTLFAILDGEKPRRDVVTNAVYGFFGDYQRDDDEENYEHVINEMCALRTVEMYGYTFFFHTVKLYIGNGA